MGSEKALQIAAPELDLAEDVVELSRANRFPGMDRNHGGSAIRMPEKVMASFHPEGFKPQLLAGEGSPSTSR